MGEAPVSNDRMKMPGNACCDKFWRHQRWVWVVALETARQRRGSGDSVESTLQAVDQNLSANRSGSQAKSRLLHGLATSPVRA